MNHEEQESFDDRVNIIHRGITEQSHWPIGSEELKRLRYIIPEKLAYVSLHPEKLPVLKLALQGMNIACVSSDLHRQYTAFCSDFGPVNLAVVHRFCRMMQIKIQATGNGKALLYCIEPDFESLANASFLLAAYLLLRMGHCPAQATEPFTGAGAPFVLSPFRDATFAPQTFELRLRDCIDGLYQAVQLGWYRESEFDVSSYDELDSPHSGDIHQVHIETQQHFMLLRLASLCIFFVCSYPSSIPAAAQVAPKLIAFKGPLAPDHPARQPEEVALPPSESARRLRGLGVTCVVRLNDVDTYDAGEFTRAGIGHEVMGDADSPEPIAGTCTDAVGREGEKAAEGC